LSDGVLYKANATVWSKSQAKKFSASAVEDGSVKHADASTWYKNYPMQQTYEAYFNASWTHGYKWGTGQILDEATWGNHPRCGDATADFCGMWGFDHTAIANFIGTGVLQALQIEVMFDNPSHTGNPAVYFGKHNQKLSTHPSTFSQAWCNTTTITNKTFTNTGADYESWITLPTTLWTTDFGGIYVHATPTATNSARFAGTTTSNGLNGYNSRLYVKVLK
jgi:hypothetical protein